MPCIVSYRIVRLVYHYSPTPKLTPKILKVIKENSFGTAVDLLYANTKTILRSLFCETNIFHTGVII